MQVELTRIDWLIAAPLLWLAGAAVALLLSDAIRPNRSHNFWIAMAGLAGAAIGLIPLFHEIDKGQFTGFSGMLRPSWAGLVLSLVCLGSAACAGMLSRGRLENEEAGRHSTALWTLLLLAPFGMLLTLWADHLVVLFLGIETFSLPLYAMAALQRRNDQSIEAGMKYFLLGAFASGFLAFGMALLYAGTGSMNSFALDGAGEAGGIAAAGAALLLAGILFKAAAAPFHLWVADVYLGAPTPITTLMAAGTKAAAFGALIRWWPAPDLLPSWGWAALGVITLAAGNFAALNQSNLKRLLALSGVAHVGILLFAFAAQAELRPNDPSLGDAAWEGVTFYLVAYGLAALAGFGALEMLERRNGGSSETELLRGLARRDPITGAAICIAILSLAGVPLTAGFLAKYFIFVQLVTAGLTAWAVVGALLTLIAFGYYLRALVQLFMVDPDAEPDAPVQFDWLGTTAVLVPAILTVLLGIWPAPLTN